MEPCWPDPPTLLSTALRESVQADGQLIHLLDLASANLAYMFSKAANGSLSKESLGEETNKHHGLMHLWNDNIEVLQKMHNKGREQIDKSLAILNQTQQEQDGTSEAETQLRLLRTRLYELFGLFNPAQPLKVALDHVPILGGVSQHASTGNDLMGSLSAPIKLTQEAVVNEQLHAMKTINPICPTFSFGGQPMPRDPSKVKQPAIPSITGLFSDRNSRPSSSGQGLRSDASHSATDSYSTKPSSSDLFGNPPAPKLAPSIFSGSTGFEFGHEAQTTAQDPTANKQSASTPGDVTPALVKLRREVYLHRQVYLCARRQLLMEAALQGKISLKNAIVFTNRFEGKVQDLIKHERELLHAASEKGPQTHEEAR